jgi:hypothetical protein
LKKGNNSLAASIPTLPGGALKGGGKQFKLHNYPVRPENIYLGSLKLNDISTNLANLFMQTEHWSLERGVYFGLAHIYLIFISSNKSTTHPLLLPQWRECRFL